MYVKKQAIDHGRSIVLVYVAKFGKKIARFKIWHIPAMFFKRGSFSRANWKGKLIRDL
jgi:hypothetical protein